MIVSFSPKAERDLSGIRDYLTAHSPRVAERFEVQVRKTVRYVSDWPTMAALVGRRENYRAILIGHYPYQLYFRVRDNKIEILHIRHTAQRAAVIPL